jgi:TRAP-type C4-dicarboxylate transport system substrate-binding protein
VSHAPRTPGVAHGRTGSAREVATRIARLGGIAATCVALFGDPARGASESEDPAQFVLKIASVEAPGSPLGGQLQVLRQHVETATAGQVHVKLLLSGALGDEGTLVERTRAGSVQAFAGSTAAIAHHAPALDVLSAPYLFASDAQVDRAFDGPVRRALGVALPRAGLRLACWGAGDFRVWYARGKFVMRPSDAANLRAIVPRSEAQRATYGALRLAFDAAAPLAQGSAWASEVPAVDAFDDTLLDGTALALVRGSTHLTLSRHAYAPTAIVYSERWLAGLPEKLRRDLLRVPDALVRDARASLRAMTPALVEHLRRRGVDVREPSRAERSASARATHRVAKALAARAGADGWRVLSAAQQRGP